MLRRTVRNLHRHGSEAYATVEQAAGEFATVRLVRTGARYTNLPVIGRVEAGDRVIIDFSLVDRPYVRPETVDEDEVVIDYLRKVQEKPDPPLIDTFYSSLTGAKGYNLGVQHLSPLRTPPGWYDIDFDDSSWTVGKDGATYGYGGAALVGAAVVGAAIAIGTSVTVLPTACTTYISMGRTYYTCGGVYYQPVYQSGSTTYIVVNQP